MKTLFFAAAGAAVKVPGGGVVFVGIKIKSCTCMPCLIRDLTSSHTHLWWWVECKVRPVDVLSSTDPTGVTPPHASKSLQTEYISQSLQSMRISLKKKLLINK